MSIGMKMKMKMWLKVRNKNKKIQKNQQQKSGISPVFYVKSENGVAETMDTCVTSSALSTCDQPTSVEREKSEVSSVSEGSPGEGGEGGGECAEESGEAEEEEDVSKWGPLKVPVTVKIADLGNACWVVSI